MIGYSESSGKLKVEQKQVDEFLIGTFNTYILYDGEVLSIKYHDRVIRTSYKIHTIITSDALYNMTNKLDIIDRCNFYKELLDDVSKLNLLMVMKTQNGIKYSFDVEYVYDCLKDIAYIVHNDIKNIYIDLQFEATSKGQQFHIPLPDYTIQETEEIKTKYNQSSIIPIQNKDIDYIKKRY